MRISFLAVATVLPAASIFGADFRTLYTFTANADGGLPQTSVAVGPGGLYGTTSPFTEAGARPNVNGTNLGTIFLLSPPANGADAWTDTVLYTLTGSISETSAVRLSGNGVLYGLGRNGSDASGLAYGLHPPAQTGGAWDLKTLYQFTGTNGDGADPSEYAGVTGWGGALYGTTSGGGTGNYGTVFSLTPAGAEWTETVLYRFSGGSDGAFPQSRVVVGADGTVYGTTAFGGIDACGTNPGGCGAVFRLTPPASPGGAWTEDTLYEFTGGADGGNPDGLTAGPGGVLYSTSEIRGAAGFGTVFALTPPAAPGSSWSLKTLHNFQAHNDGFGPYNGVALGKNSSLYGATYNGGTNRMGTVYSLTPVAEGPWMKTTLHDFAGDAEGANPNGVVVDGQGVIYGTTMYGGTAGFGTVFAVTP